MVIPTVRGRLIWCCVLPDYSTIGVTCCCHIQVYLYNSNRSIFIFFFFHFFQIIEISTR
uniref:Uncharacterized protein n=1 Tax=Rhizophora mucronata TaxID=61149 RepID=A0A2P2INC3_RHIMU